MLGYSYSQTFSAFDDSVDSDGTCGPKIFTLNPGYPVYISVSPDTSNPAVQPFSILFDHTKATSTDIGTHAI